MSYSPTHARQQQTRSRKVPHCDGFVLAGSEGKHSIGVQEFAHGNFGLEAHVSVSWLCPAPIS